MKIFDFFVRHIFLKRWLLIIGILILFFLVNYLTFTASRSLLATYYGVKENQFLYQDDLYILNLDPESPASYDDISLQDTQHIYNYLNENEEYAIESFGFVLDLPNQDQMEVYVNYLNEEAYKLEDIQLSKGEHLSFNDYDTKPVLIGSGLEDDYPIGKEVTIVNPVTQKNEKVVVAGILEKNASHSNFYAPNSKNYYNYSLFYPVSEDFLAHSSLDLQVNALNDLILLNASKEDANHLAHLIKTETGLVYNFYNQEENLQYFKQYYGQSVKIIILITLLAIILSVALAAWNTLVSVRLMIKEFTLNLLVGLSYDNLKSVLYLYFFGLFLIASLALVLFNSAIRYSTWLNKESVFVTLGFLAFVKIDWLAMLIVIVLDVLLTFLIVHFMMRRIKKIPFSMGVLS